MSIDTELHELSKNCINIVPLEGLKKKLEQSRLTKKPLRVKLGFDPTAPDLHLGHVVVLNKLRDFQRYGHKIVIIIGDFTACIGDPTGRNKMRPPLSRDEVEQNAQTYLDQLSLIINVSEAEIRFNSEWLEKLNLKATVDLISKVTLSQILQREDFTNRYEGNIPIYFHELMYPILQGYDSYMVKSDIELGGTDQLFNCLVGRDIQKAYEMESQIVLTVPLLRGLDGQNKMSKSLHNYIGIKDTPNDMFGKVMSIPDTLILEYAQLTLNFDPEKLRSWEKKMQEQSVNPMDLKKELAKSIVSQFYGKEIAQESDLYFFKQVQSRDEEQIKFEQVLFGSLHLPNSNVTLIALCAALQPEKSKSELRQIIKNGGVTLNSEKIVDANFVIDSLIEKMFRIKIGKRSFYQINH